MVRMLGFSEEDKQRIGFAQSNAGRGVVRGVLGLPGRLVGGIVGGGPSGKSTQSSQDSQVGSLCLIPFFSSHDPIPFTSEVEQTTRSTKLCFALCYNLTVGIGFPVTSCAVLRGPMGGLPAQGDGRKGETGSLRSCKAITAREPHHHRSKYIVEYPTAITAQPLKRCTWPIHNAAHRLGRPESESSTVPLASSYSSVLAPSPRPPLK